MSPAGLVCCQSHSSSIQSEGLECFYLREAWWPSVSHSQSKNELQIRDQFLWSDLQFFKKLNQNTWHIQGVNIFFFFFIRTFMKWTRITTSFRSFLPAAHLPLGFGDLESGCHNQSSRSIVESMSIFVNRLSTNVVRSHTDAWTLVGRCKRPPFTPT